MTDENKYITDIEGSKGGGKGGGGGSSEPRAAKEAPNTLRSKATARIIDVISEGECGGLVDGAKSIFYDQTPILNANGQANFDGVRWAQRLGTPSQPYVPGFPGAESEIGVGVEVRNADGPVQRSMQNTNVDAARVTIRLTGLYKQNRKNGDIKGLNVKIAIDVAPEAGGWTNVVTDNISGKTMNAYERAYRVESPDPTGFWQVRVRRITGDRNDSNKVDNTFFSRFTEIIDVKESYDNTALVASAVDSESTGQRIPKRSFLWDGIKCRVPDNYNPDTSTYSGAWGGSFAVNRQVTDDPAWIIYEILTNERWGLGEWIDENQIDKWSFFDTSVYNNESVDDGDGGQEPRYRFANVINRREDPFKLVQAIASTCRANLFTSGGLIKLVQDRPGDIVKYITNEDVEDGFFDYKSSSIASRTTAVNITFNDENDNYLPSTVTEEDTDGINRYGYNPQDMVAYGAFTEGQARRTGKWLLYNNLNSTEIVTFRAGLNHADLEPGEIVGVMDKDYAGVEWGGRAVGGTTTTIDLDKEIEITTTDPHVIHILGADGQTWYERTVTNGVGSYTTLNLSSALPAPPTPFHTWVIEGSISARQFKVLSIREVEVAKFEITAVQHNPDKYAIVEQGVTKTVNPFSTIVGDSIDPVTNITFTIEQSVTNTGSQANNLRIEWDAPADENIKGYLLKWRRDEQQYSQGQWVQQNEFIIENPRLGDYDVQIWAYNIKNVQSPVAEGSTTLDDTGVTTLLPPTNINVFHIDGATGDIVLTGGNFTGPSFSILWDDPNDNVAGDATTLDYLIETVDATFTKVRNSYRTTERKFIYPFEQNENDYGEASRNVYLKIYIRDTLGRLTNATTATISNPAPPVPQSVNVSAGFENVYIRTVPSATDAWGFLVWIKTTQGVTPTLDNIDLETTSTTAMDVAAATETTYYVRVAHYDRFGFVDFNASSEFSVTTNPVTPSFVTPDAPSNLTLSTQSVIEPSGTEIVSLTAEWTGKELFFDISPQTTDVRGMLFDGSGEKIHVLGGDTVYEYDMDTPYAFTTLAYNSVSFSLAGEDINPLAIQWVNSGSTLLMAGGNTGKIYKYAASSPYDITSLIADANTIDVTGEDVEPVGVTTNDTGTKLWILGRATDTIYEYDLTSAFDFTTATYNSASFAVNGQVTTPQAMHWRNDGVFWVLGDDTKTIFEYNLGTVDDITTASYSGTNFTVSDQDNQPTAILFDPNGETMYMAGVENNLIHRYVLQAFGDINTATYDSSEITNYDVQIREGSGSYIQSNTRDKTYQWTGLRANTEYTVRVRSRNATVVSSWTPEVSKVTAQDSTPPAPPSGLTAVGSFRNIFLEWTNPTDSDFAITQVWSNSVNDRNSATLATETNSNTATISGFTTGVTRYYWIRSLDRSGNASTYHPSNSAAGVSASTVGVDTADYIDLSIVNAKIGDLAVDNGKIADAAINNAKIEDATIQSAKIDEIDASKINISGTTQLSDWRNGGDNTKIEGGSIATNTIRANQIEIGSRNVNVTGIVWSPDKSADNLSWTGGTVYYNRDSDNATDSRSISGGSASYSGSPVYIYWVKGQTQFNTTTSVGTAYGNDRMVMCVYYGGKNYAPTMGSTNIDGTSITTGSITASELIQTQNVITNSAQLGNAVIGSANIQDLSVETIKIANAAVSSTSFLIWTDGADFSQFVGYGEWSTNNLQLDYGISPGAEAQDFVIVSAVPQVGWDGVNSSGSGTAKIRVRVRALQTVGGNTEIGVSDFAHYAYSAGFAVEAYAVRPVNFVFTLGSSYQAGDNINVRYDFLYDRGNSGQSWTAPSLEGVTTTITGFKK